MISCAPALTGAEGWPLRPWQWPGGGWPTGALPPAGAPGVGLVPEDLRLERSVPVPGCRDRGRPPAPAEHLVVFRRGQPDYAHDRLGRAWAKGPPNRLAGVPGTAAGSLK